MFSKRLKESRITANLTLEELANQYNEKFGGGLNKGTLSKYENGKQQPLSMVICNLAELLNVSTDYLLGKTDWKTVEERDKHFNEWDKKYNPNGELSEGVKMYELIDKKYSINSDDAHDMLESFSKLNDLGKSKAIETVGDLTEIPKYTNKEKPKYIYRVARSTNNANAEILERDDKAMERLKSAKKITSDEDI